VATFRKEPLSRFCQRETHNKGGENGNMNEMLGGKDKKYDFYREVYSSRLSYASKRRKKGRGGSVRWVDSTSEKSNDIITKDGDEDEDSKDG